MRTTRIGVRLQEPGFHSWPDVPNDHECHYFLQYLHRHVFHFEIVMNVKSSREKEFFVIKEKMFDLLNDLYATYEHGYDFVNDSCEQIADKLMTVLEQEYGPLSIHSVRVSEDNENYGEVVQS